MQVGAMTGEQQPYLWGAGGQRMTPEQIASQNKMAQALMASGSDFSPVQHWSQGLARVAQALMGGLEARQARKAEEANMAHSQEVMGGLTQAGTQPTMEAAMRAATDPYASPEAQKMGAFWMDRLAPKPSTAQPYRFSDNAGNVWQQMPDGSNKLVFVDKAPKQIVANGQLITSTNPYVDGAQPGVPGTPVNPSAMLQPGAIVDDPRKSSAGGPTQPASGTFRG
jgi:hypothetical protein